ncbi:TrbI/VirB10 family protein [Cupriavidus respiraculi]|uniref:Type IV secretion system protein VirB10 n=2 Tax=Cupriavidus respiraculi TaxID=195930 RepID=A0ABM8XUF9_9BURK|nr:TrbI/VirB10 family protein [Cupriavidus respiraculi]CAG9184015.1 hypothetical protein LMG21510_05002 [Cupriavidus respiraculi]
MDEPASSERGVGTDLRQGSGPRAGGRNGRPDVERPDGGAFDAQDRAVADASRGPSASGHEEREAAIRAWEVQCDRPLLAEGGRARRGAIWAGALLLGAVGGGWLLWRGEPPAAPRAGSDSAIAERKPVPKLHQMPFAGASAASAAGAAPAASTSPPFSAVDVAVPPDDPLRSRRDELALQREEQARKLAAARLKSAILVPVHGEAELASGEGGAAPALGADGGQSGARADVHAEDGNARFADRAGGTGVAMSMASRIGDLDQKVLRGKWIEAVLVPRAVSDLPGTLCATVQRDVYGERGRVVLIPWGSRVCGVYRAELRKGQDRLFVVWQSLRAPDGAQVSLDSAGADQLGSAGMGGQVDTHFAQIFGISALLSIIGAGASTAGVASQDPYNSVSSYRQSVQQAAAQSAQQALQPYLGIAPTVTVPAGDRIRILVNRDLDFSRVFARADAADAQGSQASGVTFVP